ncbi:MAG: NADH-quinone oxidoreductase subunit N [Herpetosiphonaceae bacterium]|nr:NADH-quinone oxidoreductase subunit N [Herpetosiphonaceae bacterium]
MFGRWRKDDAGYVDRVNEAATMTLFGLGFAFLVTIIQGGFLLPKLGVTFQSVQPSAWWDIPSHLTNVLTNLRSSGLDSTILGGGFVIDPLTHIGRLVFIGAAIVTVILTMSARPSNSPGEFYALILFSTLGMILMTAAGELIMIYLGIEMTSIPLYVLAGYFRRNKLSAEAGVKYYIFGALSSAILLFGMSLVLGMTLMNAPAAQGEVPMVPTSLPAIALAVQNAFATPNDPGQAVLLLGLIFMIAGMAYKVAVVPFHSWAPDVYQGAPTTMTAFISTASKTAGFFLLYRVLLTGFGAPQTTGTAALVGESGGLAFGGWASIIAIIAALTMLLGNLAAMPQTNAKRMLAYSSIAHAGFLLLGLVGISRDSGVALVYYLVVYTITNLGAFGIMALIEDQVGGTEINDLNGLGKRAPMLAFMLTIFVLSLAGIPPLSGFFAKFYIFIVAWQEGAKWLVILAVANTVISLFYYLRMLKAMYIAEPDSDKPVTATFGARSVMMAAMLLVLALGVVPNIIYGALEQVAISIAAR